MSSVCDALDVRQFMGKSSLPINLLRDSWSVSPTALKQISQRTSWQDEPMDMSMCSAKCRFYFVYFVRGKSVSHTSSLLAVLICPWPWSLSISVAVCRALNSDFLYILVRLCVCLFLGVEEFPDMCRIHWNSSTERVESFPTVYMYFPQSLDSLSAVMRLLPNNEVLAPPCRVGLIFHIKCLSQIGSHIICLHFSLLLRLMVMKQPIQSNPRGSVSTVVHLLRFNPVIHCRLAELCFHNQISGWNLTSEETDSDYIRFYQYNQATPRHFIKYSFQSRCWQCYWWAATGEVQRKPEKVLSRVREWTLPSLMKTGSLVQLQFNIKKSTKTCK